MTTSLTVLQFRCEPLNCWLERAKCGRKHLHDKNGTSGQRLSTCARCDVGAAHARSEEPQHVESREHTYDVPTLPEPGSQSLTGGAHTTTATRAPKPAKKPALTAPTTTTKREGSMPRGKTYEYQGDRKTVIEWARDARNTAGLSDKALAGRLNAGWPVADALTVPKGARMGANAHGTKPKRAAKKTTKAKAGAALNKLFESGSPARAPSVQRDTKPKNGRGAALDLITADVDARAAELEQLRITANTLAALWGLPQPYPGSPA